VIGVHSGKFDQERQTENIQKVLERYQVHQPVINDKWFEIWRRYGVRVWPTLVLIDPNGFVIGAYEGENILELLDKVLKGSVDEFERLGILDKSNILHTRPRSVNIPLRFPGKVLADNVGGRIFISDSNHNRLVVTAFDGTVLEVVGSGVQGFSDGSYQSAQFFRPQGVSLADQDTLYVADTANHAIRKVDLVERTVETVIGAGERGYPTPTSAKSGNVALNSPWDVEFLNGIVYIAMAG
jgi:DNA-binding beta-propeller fold protein YncE